MNNIKNELKDNYTIIPNELLQSNLSDRAKITYCVLASKPNDWNFFNNSLANELGFSVETLQKYISELVESGWILKEKKRGEHGLYANNDYVILPKPKKPVTEKHGNGKNRLPKKPVTYKEIPITKKYNNKEVKANFEKFWNLYDKKTGKEKTFIKWKKLKDSEKEKILEHVPKYVESTPDKKFRKNPLTYLNGKHWEDEIIMTNKTNFDNDLSKWDKYE